jgi:hypothetical protein
MFNSGLMGKESNDEDTPALGHLNLHVRMARES